jgi:hypothetical protein
VTRRSASAASVDQVTDVPPPNVPGSTPPPPPPGATPIPPPPPANLTPPPGYTAYNTAPTPAQPLSRVKGLSTAIVVLTALAGLGAIVTALTTPSATDSANDFLAGRISEDQFLDDYAAFGLMQGVQGIATLATAVLTMIWLYRVASNLRKLGRATTWAPIWAVFGWILPPVLIIIPFLMVREVWKASTADAQGASWKQAPENPMIWAWFVVYGLVPTVISAISLNATFGAGFSQDTDSLADTLNDFGSIQIIGSVFSVIAAITWIIVVRQLTGRHTKFTHES